MTPEHQLTPSVFVSRFYSIMKRLSWGLFLNGFLALFVLINIPEQSHMDEKKIGICFLSELIGMPILLSLWALRRPRRYQKRPSMLTLLFFVPVLVTGLFLTAITGILVYWLVWIEWTF